MSTGPAADSWAAAVHRSEQDFEPLGAAVVIDARRVLTAAHVVQQQGVRIDPLWVAFPKAEQEPRRRCRVASVQVADHARVTDLALLVLEQDVPAGVWPARLRCPRPADLDGRQWWAFGFPGKDPLGDVAGGRIDAGLGYGWVRLATGSAGPLARGFSGGGLWSQDYQAVVGIVGQAHTLEGGGRAITLHEADRCLPGQKLRLLADTWSADSAGDLALASWGWRLSADPEGDGTGSHGPAGSAWTASGATASAAAPRR
ncbi:trypsin-like peptidase domain-containing protein [Nonomuraea sp. NN258]|uniref:S1 family peptidase n=1 Tax=Nonomuraea antri TaxID=2730852 RepID=UPI00156A5370|nr:serine protease [Nonomuraea antri]NRQ33377.1 trypsin-like peptidase domain-containing protein [Nonomuraea antri]